MVRGRPQATMPAWRSTAPSPVAAPVTSMGIPELRSAVAAMVAEMKQSHQQQLRLMERENEGLVGVGDKEGDPMTSNTYVVGDYDVAKYTQRGGGCTPASIPDDPLSTSTHHHQHPRLSRLPPYDGYHESHVAPYKKTSGGMKIPEHTPYLDEIKAWGCA